MTTEPDFSARAVIAAREILALHDVNDMELDPTSLRAIMPVLAAHDLLRFGFSSTSRTGPATGDMDKACHVIRGLASQSGTLASLYMVSGLLGPLCLSLAGTAEQKDALLTRAAAGDLQLAFALTEPGSGSDAASITTTALPAEGGGYTIDGHKTYISGAATADLILTVAKSSASNAKAFGIFMVPAGAPGMTITPVSKIAGNDHASCEIDLVGSHLQDDAVLGGAAVSERAWAVLRQTGMLERLLVAAMACGFADAATERAQSFIGERHQFGKPLKDFQTLQHAVVEMATLARGMWLFVQDALRVYESGEDATQAISMAKYFCCEQLQRVIEIAMRVMGGRAYFDFEPVSRLYREAPFCLYAGGTIEIQKMLIARTLGI